MPKLIEFYEMVSLNDATLAGGEKMAPLNARRALRPFAEAMEIFKQGAATAPPAAEGTARMACLALMKAPSASAGVNR